MANYQLLKADIDKKVYQNGHQEITGANLNSVLNAMVTTLGAEYQFAGVATTATNPGTPDAKVFYIANGKGTYTNFGGIEVTEDEVVVLYWDTAWHKEATGIASADKLNQLSQYTEERVGTINYNSGVILNQRLRKDGTFVSDGSCYTTEFLKVTAGETIIWTPNEVSSGIFLIQYASDKTTIKDVSAASALSRNIVIVASAEYVRATFSYSKNASITIKGVVYPSEAFAKGNSLITFDKLTNSKLSTVYFDNGDAYIQGSTLVITNGRVLEADGLNGIIQFNVNLDLSGLSTNSYRKLVYKKVNGSVSIELPNTTQAYGELVIGYVRKNTLNYSVFISGIGTIHSNIDRNELPYISSFRNVPRSIGQGNHYIDASDGTNGPLSNYFISNEISLSKGETILLISAGATYASPISKVENGVYTPIKGYSNSVVLEENTYTAKEDVTVVLCCRSDYPFEACVYKYNNDIKSAIGLVSKDVEEIQLDAVAQEAGTNARYISYDRMGYGWDTGSTSTWSMANISLVKGDSVRYIASVGADGGTMVALGIKAGTRYIPIHLGTITSHIYNFVADNDCVIGVSWKTTEEHKMYITRASEMDGINKSLANTDKKVNLLNKGYQSREILNIAYSYFQLAPINSAEHFLLACKAGFNSLKADVAMTADGELVCWHDNIKEDGSVIIDGVERTTIYDTTDQSGTGVVKIADKTLAQLKDYVFKYHRNTVGYYATMCTIDEYLYICKLYDKIPFITIRNNEQYALSSVMPKLIALLNKYDIKDRCIINLYEALFTKADVIRTYDADITMCFTTRSGVLSNNGIIDLCAAYKNMIIAFDAELLDESVSLIQYAQSLGLEVFAYSVNNYEKYSKCIKLGLTGFQITKIFEPKVVRESIMLRLEYKDGNARLIGTFNNSDPSPYSCDIDLDAQNNQIILSNIDNNGNQIEAVTGVPPVWLNVFPYNISVIPDDNYECSVKWQNSSVIVSTPLDSNKVIKIIIEV